MRPGELLAGGEADNGFQKSAHLARNGPRGGSLGWSLVLAVLQDGEEVVVPARPV